jgi:hypothetical protein
MNPDLEARPLTQQERDTYELHIESLDRQLALADLLIDSLRRQLEDERESHRLTADMGLKPW